MEFEHTTLGIICDFLKLRDLYSLSQVNKSTNQTVKLI